MIQYKLHLFGSPFLEAAGKPVPLDTRKAIALTAYLVVINQAHTRDALAALFWPESDESHAKAALRRTLSSLRTALGNRWLNADRELIWLNKDEALWIDFDEFQHRLAQLKGHGHPAHQICPLCQAPLTEAVALYAGDFLAGFSLPDSAEFDQWHFFQMESLRRNYSNALRHLVDIHMRNREFDRAIEYARRWLATDPLHEPAHRQLMRLYALNNQRAAALRQYRECVRELAEELGVPPLDETVQLYEAIQAKQLDVSTVEEQPFAAATTLSMATSIDEKGGGRLQLPLVGRLPAWSQLLTAYRSGQQSSLIVIEGEAGIGKTRLAEEFLEHVRNGGAQILQARCYPDERELAYGPLMEALRRELTAERIADLLQALPQHQISEITRLLPELAPAQQRPAPPDGPGARSQFFRAIANLLTFTLEGKPQGVLFLDDLQWIDQASQDLLAYVVRRAPENSFCLLVTWRGDDVRNEHPLRQLLADAKRMGRATHVELKRLDRSDVEMVVNAIGAEIDLPPHAVQALFTESEGLPFYLAERLALVANRNWAEQQIPEGVQALFRSRLIEISQQARQLLTTAAVIGRSFGYETLRDASGRSDEETVEALDELLVHGLLREVSGPQLTYDFSHETLRSLVYDQASFARRRLLHRRIAQLYASPGHQANASLQLAHHLQQAGQEGEAALVYASVAERARVVYANSEALAHFQTALALDHPERARLHEAVGDLETLAGSYSRALLAYENALATAENAAQIQARVERKIGEVYHRLGEWTLAEEHFKTGLSALTPEHQEDEEVRLLSAYSSTMLQQEEVQRANLLAAQAYALAKRSGTPQALAQVENILGLIARRSGDNELAQHHLEQSLHSAISLNDLGAQTAALNNLALIYAARGETERALHTVEHALALCRTCGDRHREAALLNHLADLLHATGRRDEAMTYLKDAVAIFAEIGEEFQEPQPEIWKLVAW